MDRNTYKKVNMKLTNRILQAVIDMAILVELGDAETYQGADTPETRKQYKDACDAGEWATQLMHKRMQRKKKTADNRH